MIEESPNIVENVKVIKLEGLKRRIMIIINNKGNWISAKMIREILVQAYHNETIDKLYKPNWIYIVLRELKEIGLLDKRRGAKGGGNSVLYRINDFGLKQLNYNLKNNNYNNELESKESKQV
jgi:hypothetical protein